MLPPLMKHHLRPLKLPLQLLLTQLQMGLLLPKLLQLPPPLLLHRMMLLLLQLPPLLQLLKKRLLSLLWQRLHRLML